MLASCHPIPPIPPTIHPQVQEASAATAGFWSMPDAWVNLANVYLEREQYASAIQARAAAAACDCCSPRTLCRRTLLQPVALGSWTPAGACPSRRCVKLPILSSLSPQMYQSALRKFYDNRSANVMLYLAR